MQLRNLLTLAVAICDASHLTATFRSIPIALPPLGEPLVIRAKGSYTPVLVHRWPPVHFDRWTPIEYYEPHGYVYLNEDDGLEYIFDSEVTRPVLRATSALAQVAVVAEEEAAAEREEVIAKVGDVEAVVVEETLTDRPPSVFTAPTAAAVIATPAAAAVVYEPVELPYKQKGLHLRGVVEGVENLTNLPAAFMKDAFLQSRAFLRDKLGRGECVEGYECGDIAETWVAYVSACQEKAKSLARAFYEVLAPLSEGRGSEELVDEETLTALGRTLVEKVEAARRLLVTEAETLPNVIDKTQLVRLLTEPLDFFQEELLFKVDPRSAKEELHSDLYQKGIEKVNDVSFKFENAITNAVEQLIRFPTHIVQKVGTSARDLAPSLRENVVVLGQDRDSASEKASALQALNFIPQLTGVVGVVPSFFKPVLGNIF